jgi:hypothetical protein
MSTTDTIKQYITKVTTWSKENPNKAFSVLTFIIGFILGAILL